MRWVHHQVKSYQVNSCWNSIEYRMHFDAMPILDAPLNIFSPTNTYWVEYSYAIKAKSQYWHPNDVQTHHCDMNDEIHPNYIQQQTNPLATFTSFSCIHSSTFRKSFWQQTCIQGYTSEWILSKCQLNASHKGLKFKPIGVQCRLWCQTQICLIFSNRRFYIFL